MGIFAAIALATSCSSEIDSAITTDDDQTVKPTANSSTPLDISSTDTTLQADDANKVADDGQTAELAPESANKPTPESNAKPAAKPANKPTDVNNPCPSHQFQDLSSSAKPCRDRYLAVGAEEAGLNALYARGNVQTPGCGQSKIQQAIDSVSASGGGVVQLPACEIALEQTPGKPYAILIKSNVVLKGAGVDKTVFKRKTFRSVNNLFMLKDAENVVIEDISIDANSGCGISVLATNTKNLLVQRTKMSKTARTQIRAQTSSAHTYRYNTMINGRGTDSAGDCDPDVVAHGINSEDCSGWDPCSKRTRSLAVYSNITSEFDGNGIDLHSSDTEVMGNKLENNQWNSKFPDSQGLMVHSNLFRNSDHKVYDGNFGFTLLLFKENQTIKDAVVFNNVFTQDSQGATFVRFDDNPVGKNENGGEVWFINNTYKNVSIKKENNLGTLYYCAGSNEAGLATGPSVVVETRTSLCSLNRQDLINLTGVKAY